VVFPHDMEKWKKPLALQGPATPSGEGTARKRILKPHFRIVMKEVTGRFRVLDRGQVVIHFSKKTGGFIIRCRCSRRESLVSHIS